MDKSDIAKRMKIYEKRDNSLKFMPYIPICARIDGRSFSKFTKGLDRPYDKRFNDTMIAVTKMLVKETGAVVGYTQSDEISLVWLQNNIKSQLFFDAKQFKMISNIASLATIFFYKELCKTIPKKANTAPTFDCRVWQVPTITEATNYLVWREFDATKNSISMLAQANYSHKELYKKNSKKMLDMLIKKGVNWNDEPVFFKRGIYVKRRLVYCTLSEKEISKLPDDHPAKKGGSPVFTRRLIKKCNFPPITKIANREDVIFNDSDILMAD